MNEDSQHGTNTPGSRSEDQSRKSSGISSPDSDDVGFNAARDVEAEAFDFVETVTTKLNNIAEQKTETKPEESKEAPVKPFRNGLDMFAEEGDAFGENYNVCGIHFVN